MIDDDSLNVWIKDQIVGYLWKNSVNSIGFEYDAQWLKGNGYPLSQSLPLTAKNYAPEDGVAHRFFANLLPEGGARERIVRDLKLSNTEFNLLRAIGGECAGALSILPVEQSPTETYKYQELNANEVASLVKLRGISYSGDTAFLHPRLSLAGAQYKCAVKMENGKLFLPLGTAPSTHILKFESPDYKNLAIFEVFTTLLAQKMGLPVVEVALMASAKQYYASVMRYDRNSHSDGIERLHQEDFCQAMDFGYDKKYQIDGGPSFADSYLLLMETSSEPAIDGLALLRWMIFNVLVGNSDGHAKNISLLYPGSGQVRLAPFYDLVCTRAFDRIDSRLAFSVGEKRDPELVTINDWKSLAKACDISGPYLIRIINKMSAELQQAYDQTKTDFESSYGNTPALQRIEKVIKKQINIHSY